MLADLRYACRRLALAPGFTLVVVVTLGLAIGANTALFSIMDQLLLRRLPVRAPDELVVLDAPGYTTGSIAMFSGFSRPISYPMYRDLRDGCSGFAGVLARVPASVNLTRGEATERVSAELASGNYFEVLGVEPALGRLLGPEDDRLRLGHPVVVLSHAFWTRAFGADPGVPGRGVRINGHDFTVLGVAARGFGGVEVGQSVDVFLPMAMKAWVTPAWDDMENRRVMWVTAMARLKPGVPAASAAAACNAIYASALEQEAQALSDLSQERRLRFVSKRLELLPGATGRSDLRNQFREPLLALMVMTGFVLLIACANVANLLTARATARQREVAVRLSLGASRPRLVRQLLAEGLLLSLLGGGCGLLLAFWISDALLAALPFEPGHLALSASPDARVIAFTLGICVLTTLLFGLFPALDSSRSSLLGTLREETGRLAGGRGQARARRALVAAEVALSLLLLVGAGLFARSLHNLRSLNPGFDPLPLLTFSVDPELAGYSNQQAQTLAVRLRDDLAALPGVRRASMAQLAVLTRNDSHSTVKPEGYQAQEGEDMSTGVNYVGADFLETLGVVLLRGRGIGPGDGPGAPPVAVVNETLARRFFPAVDPIGRHIAFSRSGSGQPIEIVGVARDGKHGTLREEPQRMMYVPHAQRTDDFGALTFYLRTTADPLALTAAVRQAVRRVDASLPVNDLEPMTQVVDESLFSERLVSALSAAFGLLATVLAATGLYAVLSFSVARRTREIGVRMALGAARGEVVRLVLRDILGMAGAGIAVGLPLAVALGQALRSQLFGLEPTDPVTLAAATALLLAVTLAAGYLPARRATRLDPALALRHE
jgi:predicted permease